MKPVKTTFILLTATFLLILAQFFLPPVNDLFQGSMLFLLPMGLFCLLGLVLVITTLKQKIKGKIKKFLLLTGGSAIGFFLGSVLHNVFYALGILTEKIAILHYLMEFLHVAFFLIATIGCPIGFLVGAIGSIILLKTKEN